MSRAPFELAERSIEIGARAVVRLPLAQLPVGPEITVKVIVVHGAQPGPTAFISAAVHGDELNGIAIARDVALGIEPKSLAGTLLIVPVANPFAVIGESRYLPDRRDLNRSFPGRAQGPLATQLAWTLDQQILARSQYGIDLHSASGGRNNLPQLRIDFSDPRQVLSAQAFAPPAIVHSAASKGTLRQAAMARGTEVLLYEAGEAHRFGRRSIRIGIDGVQRALQHWNMIEEAPAATNDPPLLRTRRWLRAPMSGLLKLMISVGDWVEKGQHLADIIDEVGLESRKIKAPFAGLVIGRLNVAVAYRGDAVLHVATAETLT